MLESVLRDQAAALRGLADELEAVANVLEDRALSSSQPPVVPVADYGQDFKSSDDEPEVLGSETVVRYPYSQHNNMDGIRKLSMQDFDRGYVVLVEVSPDVWKRLLP